jgi:chitinase
MRALARLLLPALALATPLPLFGYLCPTCPSAPNPTQLLAALHPSYSRVLIAFVGWDAEGHALNQYDDPSKNFTLTRSVVASLQAQGRTVFLSLGGGAGNVLTPSLPAMATLAGELGALVEGLGVDGVDLDLENFEGDPEACMAAALALVTALRQQHPALLLSAAPQMTDVFPDYLSVTAGFNRFAPLLAEPHVDLFDAVMPQLYNAWAGVETLAYGAYYAASLQRGFEVSGAAAKYNVTVPSRALLLGFPASHAAAGSGWQSPAAVVALARALAANATPIRGLMTWSVGWDQQNAWEFAEAVRTG